MSSTAEIIASTPVETTTVPVQQPAADTIVVEAAAAPPTATAPLTAATDAAGTPSAPTALATANSTARLNANAKSFVPIKLDEAAVGSAAPTPTANNTAGGILSGAVVATANGGTVAAPSVTASDAKARKEKSPKAPATGNKHNKSAPFKGNPPLPGQPMPSQLVQPNFMIPGMVQTGPYGMVGPLPPFGMPPTPMMMGNPMLMNPNAMAAMAAAHGLPHPMAQHMGGHMGVMQQHHHHHNQQQQPQPQQQQQMMIGPHHQMHHHPMHHPSMVQMGMPPPSMSVGVGVHHHPNPQLMMNPMAVSAMNSHMLQQQQQQAMTPAAMQLAAAAAAMQQHQHQQQLGNNIHHHHQQNHLQQQQSQQQQQQQQQLAPPTPNSSAAGNATAAPSPSVSAAANNNSNGLAMNASLISVNQQPATNNSQSGITNGGLMTLMTPASPLVGMHPAATGGGAGGMNASMNVSVGNASLAALRSNAPAKFACVILIGLPSSGKTTIGRQLVSELSEDKMGWSFFSGSDYLKESATKKAPWETTRDVFDGLGSYIDGIIAAQTTNPTRGLVIDKNVKGMEDIYYLSGLLKSKGLMLNGIVSFDATNDETLLERLGGEDGKERLKFYRVILNRIQEGAKGSNLFHVIDSSRPLVDSLKALRTQVLGCSAMQNVRTLNTSSYGDTNCQLVDDYSEYFRVMTAVSTYAKTPKANQFPGLVNYTPLSNKTLDDRKFRAALVDGNSYCVRRKVDGTKFILYHDNGQLYLIPRHQRAILRVPLEAWIGFSLISCGPFILDGELVRMTKESNREKFLVYDVVFWAEKGSTQNVCRGPWKERQDRLRSYLVNETNAFFQVKTNIVIVHQKISTTKDIGDLFEASDYPVEGLAFHPTARREDAVILWRPPRQLTADFRLGAVTATAPGANVASPKDSITTHTYDLEVFDSKSIPARYAVYGRYGGVEVAVGSRQAAPTPGAIVTCGLQFDSETSVTGKRTWKYLTARPDLAIPIFKIAADELMDECIVPKERLTKVLVDEKLMVDPAAKAAADAAAAQLATVGRTGFGTLLSVPSPQKPSTQSADAPAVPAPSVVTVGGQPVTVPRAAAAVVVPSQPPTMRDILIGLHKRPAGGAATSATPTVVVGVSPAAFAAAAAASSGSVPMNVSVGVAPSVVVGVAAPTNNNNNNKTAAAAPTVAQPTVAEKKGTDSTENIARTASNAKNEKDTSAKKDSKGGRGENHEANTAVTSSSTDDRRKNSRNATKEATTTRGKGDAADKEGDVAATDARRRCADCKREKNEADGRVDKSARNRPFFCFGCWAKVGTEFCQQCSAFAKGHRDAKGRNKNSFYCEPCWVKYDERKQREKEEAAATSSRGKKERERSGAAAASPEENADAAAAADPKTTATAAEKKGTSSRGRRGKKDAANNNASPTESEKDGEKKEKSPTEAASGSRRGARNSNNNNNNNNGSESKTEARGSGGRSGRASNAAKKLDNDGEKKDSEKKEDQPPSTEAKNNNRERKPRERKERGGADGTTSAAAEKKKNDASSNDDDDNDKDKRAPRRGRRGGRGRKSGNEGDASSSPAAGSPAAPPQQKPAAVVVATA